MGAFSVPVYRDNLEEPAGPCFVNFKSHRAGTPAGVNSDELQRGEFILHAVTQHFRVPVSSGRAILRKLEILE